jgi:hypothetical protein
MGYKMKHKKGDFPFKSPAKVSDEAVVAAQAKLDKIELDFREPGWAQVARGIHEGATSVLSSFGGGDEPENGNGNGKGSDLKSVQGILEGMQGEGLGEGEIGDVIIDDTSVYG